MSILHAWRRASFAVAALALLTAGGALSACSAVQGAGQDVSAIGNTVAGGASQTQRATGLP
ncbi:MAG: entericidin [Alphaproteobacteria bacterium]|nr:entericidin [Alphaproteobacteria bacterium]